MTFRRQFQQGYALIFVFAMSAMMALMLYMELPRLALEMQRNREELLIERGEQYARAVKVFQKKNKKVITVLAEADPALLNRSNAKLRSVIEKSLRRVFL